MKPITIGKKTFPSCIFYAPLAGCSDYPFRIMSQKYKPGLVFCEMVKIDALVRGDKNSFRLLDFTPAMHPIGAQLCGSNIKLVSQAARIVEDLGFDLLDLNCGCPVDKVTKDGSGSGLLKEPEKIGELISKMTATVNIPVTVKIRVGWDLEHIVAPQVTEIAESAGAQAIFIHGRTRVQAYKGRANWDYIAECKKRASVIKVFGNGDVFEAKDALNLLDQTRCDGVLVSRGTLGQPWIAEDIHRAMMGLPELDRNFDFKKQNLEEHFNLIESYSAEKKAILDMRRVGCWYFKKGEEAKIFRKSMSQIKSTVEARALIRQLNEEMTVPLVSSC